MSAEFRTACHALGLSAQAVATLARVQERTVRHWWAKGEPPDDVWQSVRAIEALFGQAINQALQINQGSTRAQLRAWREAEDWWRAQPQFAGLPIQTHSILLERTRKALEQAGCAVQIDWEVGNDK